MTKRSGGALVLVAIVALVGIWLTLTGQQPGAVHQILSTPVPPVQADRSASSTPEGFDSLNPTRARPRTVASILAGRRNVAEGLTEALAVFGPKDPDLVSAAGMALAACGQAQNQEHFLADPRSPLQDARKLEALEKLQILCKGFDGTAFFRQLDTYERRAISDGLHHAKPEIRLANAQRVVAAGVNTYDLISAGDSLITQKRIPLGEILGPQAPSEWLQLSENWGFAAELSTCARQLGCGPDALPTLVICMNMGGCEPGQGYKQVLETNLPAKDLHTVLAFRQWIARQRR